MSRPDKEVNPLEFLNWVATNHYRLYNVQKDGVCVYYDGFKYVKDFELLATYKMIQEDE